MVLGVVADGLDELVGACVEGDHVLGGVILGRCVLVHGVHCPVAGHFCVRVDCDVAVVGGEAPAGEGLAFDGRCLDACGVGGELDVVLVVVADGLDQLVLGVVEGDRVQSLIFRSRSVLVHRVDGPVAGHDRVRVDCDVAVVGGEAPAGEGLAFDGGCLDAECVLGEGGAFLPGGSLDDVSVSGVERHRGEFFFSLSGSYRILILGSISHCDCRCQGSQSRYSCNARNNLFAKRHLGKPFLSYVTSCPKAMPSKYRPECVEFPLIRIPESHDSRPLATFLRI